jgi:hypothetical protein
VRTVVPFGRFAVVVRFVAFFIVGFFIIVSLCACRLARILQ